MGFRQDFMWGAASAAYQIEGAWNEDGKGPSIWDIYSHQKGKIAHNENGDIACDHYHRFREDIAMMKALGIKYYRFSLSWSRLIPDGTGKVNEEGVRFYSELIDALLENGITPMVTLFHWDYPYALHCKGGWLNNDSPQWFEEYAKLAAERFSDRVKYWMTINEPQVFIGNGYAYGCFAPFEKHPVCDLVRMTRNVLLSHGLAVKALRENAVLPPVIGFAPTGPCYLPLDKTAEGEETAYARSFDFGENDFIFSNSWWGDPIALGTFPERAYELFPEEMKMFSEEDMRTIHQPIDFYGANIYEAMGGGVTDGYGEQRYIGEPQTQMGWSVTENALYYSAKFLNRRYKLPVLITENGMACHDSISLDGRVRDPNRRDYVNRYLRGLKRAADEGVDIIGYMYWSIMDNFEWASGYDKRFGLVYVNYLTQERIPKDSAYWYGSVIAENGENL
ncbi:MAG: GH1 family beta-glucosidase [Huintestinicola sp.]